LEGSSDFFALERNARAGLQRKSKEIGRQKEAPPGAHSFENYIIFKMQQKGYKNDCLANVVMPDSQAAEDYEPSPVNGADVYTKA